MPAETEDRDGLRNAEFGLRNARCELPFVLFQSTLEAAAQIAWEIDNRQTGIRNPHSAIRNQDMANEELIYRLTRAVYDHLGAVDEDTVEKLVTDIYREVQSSGRANGSSSSASVAFSGSARENEARAEGSAERLVVSVFGVDHPGIVAGVAQILAEAGCSIIDINQTVVRGKFAMVIIADSSRSNASAAELKERFRKQGEQLGVRIYAQREDLFNAMHRI
jgi:ACT domain-containing protein